MKDKLENALNEISDDKIAEAANHKNRKIRILFSAVAAVLVLVMILSAMQPHFQDSDQPAEGLPSQLLAAPHYPKMAPYREWGEAGYEEWKAAMEAQYDQPVGYADSLDSFFMTGIPEFLAAAEGENAVCSPVNIYMALAMLAECTDGNSRQQILNLLGVDSIEALREQAGHVWNAHFRDDELVKLLLANSLWLDEEYRFNQDVVDTLADAYYASVYYGDLGSKEVNQLLRDWINEQTGGLLKDQADGLELDPQTVLALASTIEYRVNWMEKFSESQNTKDIFHGVAGDTTVTYMKQSIADTYYVGDQFSAVALRLTDRSTMWLILPDEGITARTLLADGSALSMAMGERDNVEYASKIIHLSLPKFDVVSSSDLIGAMQNLGVTDVFQPDTADFGSICPGQELYANKMDHAARVAVDEDGVTAAAYTVIGNAAGGMPPDEEVNFVLDRPFLFVITSRDGLPLFTGIVNEP